MKSYSRCWMLIALWIVPCAFLTTAIPVQAQKKDEGKVVGKIWELEVKKAKGLKDNLPLDLKVSKFRVNGFVLYGPAGKEWGKYKLVKEDKMSVTFDVGQFKDYSIDLERSKREPPTWTGFGEKEGGEKMHFKFVFLKD